MQGRTKAVVALTILFALALLFCVVAVVAFDGALSNSNPFRFVAGLVGLAVGAWLALKLWPAVRIVRNQWSWPLEDWRVDAKGEERNEWRRWADEVLDPTH
jgi:hypothetical protein